MGLATITEWDMTSGAVENGIALTADFDPQSLELSYTTTGSAAGVDAKSSGTWNKAPSQQTGQSATLSVTLWFDTSASGTVSVQTKTDPLVLLTLPHDLSADAPVRRAIAFHWGSFLFFGCVQSLTQTIDFFSDSGVPLRASVHLVIDQIGAPNRASDPGGSGPTSSFGAGVGIGASAGISGSVSGSFSASAGVSAGIGTTPLTLSQDGDTIQGIAARAGGAVSWKAVAAANNVDNPRLLPPGTVLSTGGAAQFSAGASASVSGGASASASAG
jgi:hypothetical protein